MQDWGSAASTSQQLQDMGLTRAEAENLVNSQRPEREYSIQSLEDGRKYVKADRQVISGDNPKQWASQVTNYINQQIRNGQDVSLLTDDGDILQITRDTAGKARFRNLVQQENGKMLPMSDEAYAAKLRAEGHVDELARISARGK